MTTKDLVPLNKRSMAERKRICSAGGKASGATRRKNAAMKEVLNALLKLPIRDGKVQKKLKSIIGAKNQNITAEQAILIAQIAEALKGNTQAAVFVRDTSGNKPLPDATPDTSEFADDGFVDAIKKSAEGVWDDKDETKDDN